MSRLQGVLTRIATIIFGLFAGALATFIHFSLVPVGLIIALVGSLACSLLVRSYTRSRLSILLFAIAWALVVYRGGISAGEELLIMGNTPGETLLYLGPILVFFPIFLPRPEPVEPEAEVSELV
jgi:uncharacterized membrane protein YeaQ/YmgE (transglycosylase-associated protein family)